MFGAKTKGFGAGMLSVQLGPRPPINEVLPTRTLFCTMKFFVELIPMAKLNAPLKKLFSIVAPKLTLFLNLSPNQTRGPKAIPTLTTLDQPTCG